MSRQESASSFSEGLISDLNPINTPNSVLTDNLNGTIITYNGNEYSLQNDMGNYKLENCKLKPNYVPVGVKEYGDILYIISYNPLDEHVEIGSYPSPERIFGNEGSDELNGPKGEQIVQPILSEGEHFYSDVIINSKLYTFYNGDSGDLFLNPGDEYKIKDGDALSSLEYWHHYVLDENRRIYDVQGSVDTAIKDANGFAKVGWDVPGWLAVKINLANFTEFNVTIRQFTIPVLIDSKFTSDLDLSFQLKMRDKLFRNPEVDPKDPELGTANLPKNGSILLAVTLGGEQKDGIIHTPNAPDGLKERVADLLKNSGLSLYKADKKDKGKIANHPNEVFYQIPLNDSNANSDYLKWYPGADIYHLDLEKLVIGKSSNESGVLINTDVIKITAIPAVNFEKEVVNETDQVTDLIKNTLIYDNFEFSQNIALSSVGSIDTLSLGDERFKFWVDQEENKETGNLEDRYFSIEYNVNGPFTQNSKVNLYYAIWDIQNFESETRVTPYREVPYFNGIGQNLTQIEFDPKTYTIIKDGKEVEKEYTWKEAWEKNRVVGDDEQWPGFKFDSKLESSKQFEHESYYVIEFVFAENFKDIDKITTLSPESLDENNASKNSIKIKRFFKTIVTSIIFNHIKETYFVYDKEITLKEITDCYWNELKKDKTENISFDNSFNGNTSSWEISDEYINEIQNGLNDSEYSLNPFSFIQDVSKTYTYLNGQKYNPNIKISLKKTQLEGVLWQHVTPAEIVSTFINDEEKLFDDVELFFGDKIQITQNKYKQKTSFYKLDNLYQTTFKDLIFNSNGGLNARINVTCNISVNNGTSITVQIDGKTSQRAYNSDSIDFGLANSQTCRDHFLSIAKIIHYSTHNAQFERGAVLIDAWEKTKALIDPNHVDQECVVWYLVLKQTNTSSYGTGINVNLIPIGDYGSGCNIKYEETDVIDYLKRHNDTLFILKDAEQINGGFYIYNDPIIDRINTYRLKVNVELELTSFHVDLQMRSVKSSLFTGFEKTKYQYSISNDIVKNLNSDEFPNIDADSYKSSQYIVSKLKDFVSEIMKSYSFFESQSYLLLEENNGKLGIYSPSGLNPLFTKLIVSKLNNYNDFRNCSSAEECLNSLNYDLTEDWFWARVTKNYAGWCGKWEVGDGFRKDLKKRICIGRLNYDAKIN